MELMTTFLSSPFLHFNVPADLQDQAHVWLYNVAPTPSEPELQIEENQPFLNSAESSLVTKDGALSQTM